MRQLKSILPFVRPYTRIYLAGLALTLISNGLNTLGPQFLRRGIDALSIGAPFQRVQTAVILLVAVALVGGMARYGMRQLLNSVSRKVEYDIRNRLYQHLQLLPAEFYDRSSTGDLMARATNDLLNVRMVAGPALMYLVDTVTRTLFAVPYMLLISPRLTLLSLLPLIALPPIMIFFGAEIHRRTTAIQAQFSTLTDFVHENLSGVRIVRAYRQERAEAEQFQRLNEEYVSRNIALARAYGAFQPIMGLMGGLGALAVLFVGGRMVISGGITTGEFVAFGVYLMQLIWPMIALGWVVNLIQRGAASMGRLNSLLEEQPAIASPATPAQLPAASRARRVTYENVWFQYPNARERGWVLQDISFTVPAGGSLAIVGATGSGKSTLAELLARTYDPDQGRVLIDGVDIRTLDLKELRLAVGFVPQETFLFSDSIRENILFGAPDDGRLAQAAETAQLSETLEHLPDGPDTVLGERGINLSGGQKQRTAIARALAKSPPVFVLDDALSAVDAQTETRILQSLRSALAGRTSIIISHRLAAVRDADWILVLDNGRVAEEGTHFELMKIRGRYWELLRRQQLEEELEEKEPSEVG
ncbi:MAG TPA: ABC transporter ATP-binding protein [Gemmatimonadales bacterium]|jgi:ATP-binding cassette subfamily B protein|nr:ABC transporter ATP-binding protein [Gemmatimonadales bacterium]